MRNLADHPEVATVRQTCYACPDQWEGTLVPGGYFYLRLRHGEATLGVGDTPIAAIGDARTTVVEYEPYPDCGVFQSDEDRYRVFHELLLKRLPFLAGAYETTEPEETS